MWVEIFCGLIIYKFYRCFVSSDDDDVDVLDVETSDSKALFSVGDRLAKLYGGKVYVGLRIPDADTASPQTIDLVLVSKGEAVVMSVKNLSGLVSVNVDDSSYSGEASPWFYPNVKSDQVSLTRLGMKQHNKNASDETLQDDVAIDSELEMMKERFAKLLLESQQ